MNPSQSAHICTPMLVRCLRFSSGRNSSKYTYFTPSRHLLQSSEPPDAESVNMGPRAPNVSRTQCVCAAAELIRCAEALCKRVGGSTCNTHLHACVRACTRAHLPNLHCRTGSGVLDRHTDVSTIVSTCAS
jgi:hypothetical protein